MIRNFIILLLTSVACSASALNRIVYFRYDIPVSNTSKIIEKLNRQCRGENGRTILFYNLSTYEAGKIQNLFEQKSFLALTDVYEAIADFKVFNNLLEYHLKEEVLNGRIIGRNDDNWDIIFMLHEDSSYEDICRLIDVAELYNRSVKISFLIYDDDANFQNLSYADVLDKGITVLKF